MLVLELRDGDTWRPIGELKELMPPGSLSNRADGRREILQFECKGDRSVIRKSIGGVDAELGPKGELREVISIGFEPLATLYEGETYETDLRTDRMPRSRRIRFRHTNNPGGR